MSKELVEYKDDNKSYSEWQISKEMAKSYIMSAFKPANMKIEEALMIMETGREMGIGRMYAMQSLFNIKGKIGMKAEFMLARFNTLYPDGRIHFLQRNDKGTKLQIKKHKDDQWEEFSYTIEDAMKTKEYASNPNYKERARQMLHARCISEAIRSVAPEVNMGLYTSEELIFFDDKPDDPLQSPELEPLIKKTEKTESKPKPIEVKAVEVQINEVDEAIAIAEELYEDKDITENDEMDKYYKILESVSVNIDIDKQYILVIKEFGNGSEKAQLIKLLDDTQFWCPKSQIGSSICGKPNEFTIIPIAKWFVDARKKDNPTTYNAIMKYIIDPNKKTEPSLEDQYQDYLNNGGMDSFDDWRNQNE